MQTYLNLDKNDGVVSYEIQDKWIDIMYQRSPKVYRYYEIEIGKENLDEMKRLAKQESGLTIFINQTPIIKKNYHLVF